MQESNQTPATAGDPARRPGEPPIITDDTPIGPDIDLDSEVILLPSGTRLTNEMIPGLVEEIREKAQYPENTPTGLSDAELLKIRTEVQADSARSVLDRARACLAEEWTHDDWPSRVGALTWHARTLAEELGRVLEREQEWIRAAAGRDGAK